MRPAAPSRSRASSCVVILALAVAVATLAGSAPTADASHSTFSYETHFVTTPDGWELALELHQNPKTRDIKIAFFTSLREPWLEIPYEAREKVTNELGGITFLSKI